MAKVNIPVIDICSLKKEPYRQNDFFIERFDAYLKKHYQNLRRPHRHSFYHLVLFTKGAGTHSIDFTGFTVMPMQIYFMAPGQVHAWQFEGDTDGYIINFSEQLFRTFLFNPRYLESFSFFSGISQQGVCQVPPALYSVVLRLFEEMLDCYTNQGDAALDMVRALLLQLFLHINQVVQGNVEQKAPRQQLLLLANLRQLIDQHYLQLRLPNQYAELLYVTPNHLNALCRHLVGKTAGELIRERILLEAKRLLTNAEMSVAEIGYTLNFQDSSYFNRFFKKYTGTTPDDFRKAFTTG